MIDLIKRNGLARELAVFLTIKIAVIALIFVFFFGPGTRPDVTSARIRDHFAPTTPLTASPVIAAPVTPTPPISKTSPAAVRHSEE
jgi:hypothetical protein